MLVCMSSTMRFPGHPTKASVVEEMNICLRETICMIFVTKYATAAHFMLGSHGRSGATLSKTIFLRMSSSFKIQSMEPRLFLEFTLTIKSRAGRY